MIIDYIIYIYVATCILLILYNFIYMYKSKILDFMIQKYTTQFGVMLSKEFEHLKQDKPVSKAHIKMLQKKLLSLNSLIAYVDALKEYNTNPYLQSYLYQTSSAQQYLALKYIRKNDMHKSFFAYSISLYPPNFRNEYRPLLEILVGYLDHSSIYCRENVLKALYSIGNIYAVEMAFQFMNDHNLYHHPKLLADGLATFNGDKQALGSTLWNHIKDWDENLMLAIIYFISTSSSSFKEVFFPYVTSSHTHPEIRLEILRYYRRHTYEPIKEYLFQLLESDENVNLKIVASSVLSQYPGKDTIDHLKRALCHQNWYVRYNAAQSLSTLKTPKKELLDILHGTDQYAKEMLQYMFEHEGVKS